MSAVEQIDLVAKTRSNQRLISYLRIALPVLSVVFILLANASEASPRETQLVEAIALGGVVASVLLWSSWRYKLYGVAIFGFLFAAANVLSTDHPHDHSILGWIAGRSLSFLFVFYGVGMWGIARRYFIVSGNDWGASRKQFDDWFQNLNSQSCTNVIEFATGSFCTGYWTYRILNAGDCWVVAKFKKGTTKLATCRVLKLMDVAFTALPSGKWKIEITEKNKTATFVDVGISRPLPSTFESFVHHAPA